MDGVISTLAHGVLLPPMSLFLLFAGGQWLAVRRRRAGLYLSYGALALLYLLCTSLFSNWLVAPLENLEAPLASPQAAMAAQAIVVLAAGRLEASPEYGGQDIPDYVTLARLRYTAKLQGATGLPVLVSGGLGREAGFNEALSAGMTRALQNEFATPVKWQESLSGNTAENARRSAALLRAQGIRKIFLVTDAMHMHRARLAFEKNGMDVVAAPTVFLGRAGISLYPNTESLRRSHYALYEWLGLIWYFLREKI